MSVFYLVPGRKAVAADFARYLDTWFPGITPPADAAERLAELVEATADNHVVFADDLPANEGILATLRQSFGAQPGDWVVDARSGPAPESETQSIAATGNDKFPARLAAAC